MSSDLHRRLLVRCDPSWYGLRDNPPPTFAALRAVVELHTPGPICEPMEPDDPVVCTLHTIHCDDGGMTHCEDWPCSTIRVIAEQLGVPIEERIGEGDR